MAIKSAPPESDLPNIRKHPRASRPLWRLFGWGSAAAIALAAVALTSQTEAGSHRLQLALAYVSEPVRAVAQIPPRAAETEAETRRLAAQVRELAADRERLTARIATLERNLDDMTGSIKQPAAPTAATAPPPAPSAPATTPAVIAAAPPAPPLPVLTPLAMPAPAETAASRPATPQTQPAEAAPELVPLPPVRMAAAPASEPAAALLPPAKLEFGIDLGGAANVEALRAHWVAMKANYGPLLLGLRPVASPRLRRPAGVDYRLVAGPLPNAAAAAQLCARFPVTHTGCRPAKFEGTHLAEH
jgi:hypothetical protein